MPIGGIWIHPPSGTTGSWGTPATGGVGATGATGSSGQASAAQDSRSQLYLVRQLIGLLRRNLEAIRQPLRSTQVQRQPAVATSASSLGLADETSANLQSTEEVNATPTSFSPFGPDWNGASTAQATLDGVYDGSGGTGTLTFEVRRGGTHGEDRLRVRVFDTDNSIIQTFTIRENHDLDREYSLQNGLIFTLGPGDLVQGDTFELEVSDTVGSAVDPDKPFDGTRNDNPNLQYGLDVVAGSFTVNSVAISVLSNDTLSTVLDRISQSSAGVTATFDALTETVSLVHNTPGAAGDVSLAGDTSGFLAATKLAGASLIPGRDADIDRMLGDVPRFAAVSSGSIIINGTAVGIDVQNDSLNDIVQRINATVDDVTASFTDGGQRVSIAMDRHDHVLNLDDGGTGFLSALEIAPGEHEPLRGAVEGGLDSHNARKVADAVDEIADIFNQLFSARPNGQQPSSFLKDLRGDLRDAVGEVFGTEGRHHRTSFGIHFDWNATGGRVFQFNGSDRNRLVSTLSRQPSPVRDLFYGSSSSAEDGLVENIMLTLEDAESELAAELGSTGTYVNTWA